MSPRSNETVIDEIVASCNGDVHGALKALLLVKGSRNIVLINVPWYIKA